MSQPKQHTYYVRGMHCASCEILIEKTLLEKENIKFAEASTSDGQVTVTYLGQTPSADELNKIFKDQNYFFSENRQDLPSETKLGGLVSVFGIAGLIVAGFLFLNKIGLSSLATVNSTSSLPAFFIFGLIAGVSSCAALVGGIVLSMSKQWLTIYADKTSTYQKIQPHLLFNAGRLASYAFFGAILGLIGSKLQISLTFSSILIMVVALMMIFLALQMLGVKGFRKFQLTSPKFLSRFIADESNFKGRYMPFSLGALTFFLPCGFTLAAQGVALISGNPYQGALIMLLFSLGTLPTLLIIGLSSVKLSSQPHISKKFSMIAGILVIFFALFNINNQLNVLGVKSLNDISLSTNDRPAPPTANKNLPPIINGKQIIKMTASSNGYSPNFLTVRAGVPVVWQITDKGTSGCTNAIISKSLFAGQIDLTNGQTSVKEFTPPKAGQYKFSCWMGMISGTIEVVSSTN